METWTAHTCNTHLSSTTWSVINLKIPYYFPSIEKVHKEEPGMYSLIPISDADSSTRLQVRFSSDQCAWLCFAIPCLPYRITCSDCSVKCPCNEENWKYFFPPGLSSLPCHNIPTACSCHCKSKPENGTAVELLDATWKKWSRIRKNKWILSLVWCLLLQAAKNRTHLDVVSA